MKLKIFASIVFTVFLASCSSDVDVVIDNPVQNEDSATIKKIVIDNKTIINLKSDTSVALKLSTGTHTIQIDNKEKKDFFVTSNGGMINLGNVDYVMHELEYVGQTSEQNARFNMASFKMGKAILIDSFVVEEKIGEKELPDSILMKIIEPDTTKQDAFAKIANSNRAGFRRFGKNNFYINRDWDYGLTDTIPEKLEVKVSKYSFGDNTTTRTSIMHARMFLLYAMFNKEQYIVKKVSDVRKGVNDKKSEKQKEKKQMDF